jgi:hypothetical protein
MARKRMLSPEFFQSEGLASCSPHARLLFAGLWTLCDREGRMRWLPPVVHGQVFPFEADVSVPALTSELEAIGCVRIYEVKGKTYLDVPGFGKWQNPHKNETQGDSPAWESRDTANGCSRASHWRAPVQTMVEANRAETETETESKTETETVERPVSPAAVSVAADVLEVYAAFREIVPSSRATPTKGRVNDIKVLLREHTVAELVTMLRWAGKSDGYKYQRENGYLRWSSLLGKDGRGKVMDRIEAALSWSEGGGFTDSPDDYELPPDFDAVEIRGSWVHRAADGTWYPATKQFTNPRLPWRAELARVATARIDAKGTDLYPPADYLAAVKGSRFPADVRDPWVLQMAIDDVVNDIREERGLI